MLDLQKANMWKRISAFLFDMILMCALVVGAGFILSSLLNYDACQQTLNGAYECYEALFGVDFETTAEEFALMSEAQRENLSAAYDALSADKEAMNAFGLLVNLTLIIISLSILSGFLILEFAVPLCLKNGQTLGKKIFGIGVMHTSFVRITPLLLFIRSILGKYTLETMVPILIIIMIFFNGIGIVGTLILGALLLLQIILVIATPTNSFLHDILAKTVCIDMSSQKIFADGRELLEYKTKLHAEEAARQSYF